MISKSDYVKFVKCPKLYYLNKHCKDKAEPLSDIALLNIQHGNEIGEYARSYFGNDYYLVDRKNKTYQETVDETLKAIKNGHKIICEAAFIYKDLYCAVDILKINDDNTIDLYEVKSKKADLINYKHKPSVEKPDKFLYNDISFQYYVLSKCGYTIKEAYLLLIDRNYRFHNDLCPQKYFKPYKAEILTNVESNINKIRAINVEPNFEPCADCKECSFVKYCRKDLPSPNVFDIVGNFGSAKKYKDGIITFQDIIDNKDIYLKNESNAVFKMGLQQAEYELNNKGIYVEKDKLRKFIDDLEYPIYYFDFEGIKDYFPFIENEWIEYERPIQYSLDIQRVPGGPLEHVNYLHDNPSKPNNTEDLAKSLINNLGTKGSILVYHESYEKGRISQLYKLLPQYEKQLKPLTKRLKDLEDPFKNRWVYRKEQKGYSSIKKVLPAYCPKHADDYKNLPVVHKGDEIEKVYALLNSTTGKEHQDIYDGMIKYCSLDTMSEVYVLDALRDLLK